GRVACAVSLRWCAALATSRPTRKRARSCARSAAASMSTAALQIAVHGLQFLLLLRDRRLRLGHRPLQVAHVAAVHAAEAGGEVADDVGELLLRRFACPLDGCDDLLLELVGVEAARPWIELDVGQPVARAARRCDELVVVR